MAKKGKPGVIIYFETGRALKGRSYEEKGRLFDAILEYSEFGAVPELPPPLDMAWEFIVDKIDRDSERYSDIQEKNRLKGIISDFKRNYAPEHGLDPEDKAALAEYVKQRTPADSGQPLLTVADNGQPIRPSTASPSSSAISTSSPSPTTSSTALSSTTAAEDKGEKAYGAVQTEEKNGDMMFEDRRNEAIEKLRASMYSKKGR